MVDDLFVIVSKVPETISKCISKLRPFTSNFLFFSSVASFLEVASYAKLRLVIIDNSDEDIEITEAIQEIRKNDAFGAATILVITSDNGSESGIDALNAGANDYLPLTLVSKELAARVRMRLSIHESRESDIDLDNIYPIEDRTILKSSLYHIKNNLSQIKTVNDLSFCVGKPERDINRAFRMNFGKTAFEYMRDYRINKAKEMLFQTRFPITQIAEEVGYSSVANFSTAFKSVVGISPRSYRSQSLSIK